MPEELFVDIQGVRTRYLKDGSGPALVYWHGAGGGRQWYAHHALLAEHFTVYAPDHPGWGGSDDAEWMDTMEDYVLHYDAFCRVLGLERPCLVGHSLGGWMAAAFAVTYPDRLGALALVNAAGFPTDEATLDAIPDFFAAAARGGAAFAQMLFHKMDVAAAYFPAQPTPEDHLRFYRELTSTARLTWDRWFDAKLPRRLARLHCPTLVLWGAHERLFPSVFAHKYAEAIPDARLVLLDDCGHMVPYENPTALAREVVRLYQDSVQEGNRT